MSNIENKKTIYQLVLLNIDEEIVVEDLESRENLNALFNALEGDELVESKKYGSVWRKERQQYIEEINNTPFSTPVERIALLANHAERVNDTLKKQAAFCK